MKQGKLGVEYNFNEHKLYKFSSNNFIIIDQLGLNLYPS